MKKGIKKLIDHLSDVDDPRQKHLIHHKLIDILMITICGVIGGADGWNDIEAYGKTKKKWLKNFLELPNGIPSHDTFRKVFSNIDPKTLSENFIGWVKDICQLTKGEIIAIDGKTSRRSHEDGKGFLHMVSAWAESNNLVLGQVKTEAKSNEITAIPKLLDMLFLKGCIVTIDAMGCQKDIAEKIIEKEANYVLALKGNQAKIHEEVKEIFEKKLDTIKYDFHGEIDKGHGRLSKRNCTVINLNDQDIDFNEKSKWEKLKSIIRIDCERTVKDKTSKETRYYISSLEVTAKRFNEIIRGHWSIENSLHWILDIAFREDDSRIRTKNSAENFAILKHMALNLLKQEQTFKRGIKAKRLKAGWDDEYMLRVLNI